MNRLDCKLVQDLLPNYLENMTTAETNSFIEKHFEECKDCKKSAEMMKKEMKFDGKTEKKKIDYLKKYKHRMLILKIVIAIVLVFIVFVLMVKGYQFYTIFRIYEHNSEYYIGNNYKIISRDSISGLTSELLYKDGVSYVKNENGAIWEDKKHKYMIIFDKNQYLELDIDSVPKPLDETITLQTFGIFDVENKWQLLQSILTKNLDIHEEEYRNHKCYVILIEGEKIWVDKDTLFIVRDDYEGNTIEYYIEIDTVQENDIGIPDLKGYTKIK